MKRRYGLSPAEDEIPDHHKVLVDGVKKDSQKSVENKLYI